MALDRLATLAAYDASMRADPPPEAGVARVAAPYGDGRVLRTVGPYNFIGWWVLTDATVATAVEGEAAYFRGLGQEVEWKLFSHDGPQGLARLLAGAGFVAEETETFVALDLDAGLPPAPASDGFTVRRVTDRAGVQDLATANAAAFGRDESWRIDALAPRLEDGSVSLYVAYADDGQPISSGRLELAPGRPFAGLYGGGTDPAFRGRGVYRALVAARAAEAKSLGVRYLTVDARETSRPILQRLGFTPLATVTGWVLKP